MAMNFVQEQLKIEKRKMFGIFICGELWVVPWDSLLIQVTWINKTKKSLGEIINPSDFFFKIVLK